MTATRAEVDRATAELAARDARLAEWILGVGPCALPRPRGRRDHFAELARMILYQQLAGAAARTIHGRFEALFEGRPTPERVLAAPDADLRAAGLSAAKAAAVRDLAQRVAAGEVPLQRLSRLDDDAVVAALTRVRGVGRWTAEMFLIFRLGRLDVWPVDDLGVRKGYARIHAHRAPPAPRDLVGLGDRYRPWRSIAAWYCWRAADTVLPSGAP